ncbi:hypothetical protein [Azospirillum sp.]
MYDNSYSGFTLVQGDVDADGLPDLTIVLSGSHVLTAGNFWL